MIYIYMSTDVLFEYTYGKVTGNNALYNIGFQFEIVKMIFFREFRYALIRRGGWYKC